MQSPLSSSMLASMLAPVALVATWSLFGCQDAPREPTSGASAAATPQAQPAPTLGGSQAELADELDAAASQVEPDPGSGATSGPQAVRQRWQGKRVRWTVTRVPALCGSAESCYVQPFASARRSESSVHGWLPVLQFAGDEFGKLSAGCGTAPVCTVTIEGILDRLEVSDELPTSVHLTAVHVLAAG